ncbi:MAG: adenine phosphoribosyltransferase [Spirochaetaceae bacterium]
MKEYDLDSAIRKVPDFPKKGILFYDITGILQTPEAFRYCFERMEEIYSRSKVDAIAAVEARGFLFAAPLAEKMGLPLILLRKTGKLPGEKREKRFTLEYGEDVIQVHVSDVEEGSNILLVDDLIATGGTLKASAELLRECGGRVEDIFCVIGLPFLDYDALLSEYKVTTLINYEGE